MPSPLTNAATSSSSSRISTRGAVVVGERVRLVAVLVGHVVGGVLLGHLERELDRAVGALRSLRVDDLGSVHLQELGALGGDVVGHHGLQRVALATADHRQRDPGVAGGRLEDRLSRRDQALGLGPVDHRLGDAILDRAGRIAALELREDPHPGPRRQARQLDERRVADRLENALELAAAGSVQQVATHNFRKCSEATAPDRSTWASGFARGEEPDRQRSRGHRAIVALSFTRMGQVARQMEVSER